MKTVIIFDHPYTARASENIPHHRSFLAALLKRVTSTLIERGVQVDLIDLHADHFNPTMTAQDLSHWRQGIPCNSQVADYQQRIAAADQVIFMFPVWWELMPAMTKGFIDKVYAKNILYTAKNMKTKLNQPKIEVITTMTTPNWLYRIFFGSPLKKALFRGMFLKTRLIHFKWHNIAGLDQKSSRQKERILQSFSI